MLFYLTDLMHVFHLALQLRPVRSCGMQLKFTRDLSLVELKAANFRQIFNRRAYSLPAAGLLEWRLAAQLLIAPTPANVIRFLAAYSAIPWGVFK